MLELGRLGLRELAGRRLPRRCRRAGIVVVASDIDEQADVAAVWLARIGRSGGIGEMCQYERVSVNWQYMAGGSASDFEPTGRRAAAVAGPASMLTFLGSTGGRSRAERAAQGYEIDPSLAGWVACATFRVAREVSYLQVGARQVEVPEHGHVVVAWKAPATWRPRRPPIKALGANGEILSELGTDDHLDALSRIAIEKAIGYT